MGYICKPAVENRKADVLKHTAAQLAVGHEYAKLLFARNDTDAGHKKRAAKADLGKCLSLHMSGNNLNYSFSKEQRLFDTSPFNEGGTLHQHNFFEIMYVLKGTCIQKIEDQEYLYHAERNHNPLYQLFYESQKQAESHTKQYWEFYPIMPSNLIIPELEELFGRLILENKKMEQGSYLMIQAIIAKIFALMLNPSIYSIRKTRPGGNKYEYLFSQIYCILEEHNGRISRSELAEMLNYSDDYLNRIVKHSTGRSLLGYGKLFTLKEATRLLVQTNQSVSSIMNKLGLTNRTAFYQAFKKQYGVTPHDYRLGEQPHSYNAYNIVKWGKM